MQDELLSATQASHFVWVKSQKLQTMLQSFWFSVSAASIIFLSAIIFVYGIVHELRSTTSGKCFLIFMSSYTLFIIGLLMAHFRMTMGITMCAVVVGFIFSFIWLAILIFDNWYSLKWVKTIELSQMNNTDQYFRNVQVTTDDAKRLKLYYQSAFTVLFIFVIVLFLANFNLIARRFEGFFVGSFYIILLIIACCEVVLIILSGIKVFELSKNQSWSENAKLAEEKKRYEEIYLLQYYFKLFIKNRFWNTLTLCAVMLVSWPIELIGLIWDSSAESMIVSDFMKCYSSVVLFFVFVMQENVRVLLFNRYGSLKNFHDSL